MRLLGYLLAAKAIHTGVRAGLTGRSYSFPPLERPWRWTFSVRIGGQDITDVIWQMYEARTIRDFWRTEAAR